MAKNSESIGYEQGGYVEDGYGYLVGADFAKGTDLTVKVGVDVSDALKGLKAVERQAKKTIRALREVEEMATGDIQTKLKNRSDLNGS